MLALGSTISWNMAFMDGTTEGLCQQKALIITNCGMLYSHNLLIKNLGSRMVHKSLMLQGKPEAQQFVSTVCWAHRGTSLLAASSAGTIKLFERTG